MIKPGAAPETQVDKNPCAHHQSFAPRKTPPSIDQILPSTRAFFKGIKLNLRVIHAMEGLYDVVII